MKIFVIIFLAFWVLMLSVEGDTGDRTRTLNIDDVTASEDITWDYSVTEGITWSDGVDTSAIVDPCLVFVIATPPSKPYLSKDPNSGDWICSKHGVISPQEDGVFDMSTTSIVRKDGTRTRYCDTCLWETGIIILNQYITGVEE